jgi:hypothetical protein
MRLFVVAAAFLFATSSPTWAAEKPAAAQTNSNAVCTPEGTPTPGRHELTVCVDTKSMAKECAAALLSSASTVMDEESAKFEQDDAGNIYVVGTSASSPRQHFTCEFALGGDAKPIAQLDP